HRHFGQIRLTLIIRLTIGKSYYKSTFRVFHHPLISGLNKIVDSITTMRNINSDSHGSSNRVKINEAEAELILNSAVNISVYYLRVDGRKEKNSVNITKTSNARFKIKLATFITNLGQ
ncbi:abortive infection family protein, partial [Lacticaseibacillus paracasei]|uniref:abortive infection family protein n=1 Tax=Lacticaseibacillus paracasei TaxID=1597 RepID=UPI001614EB33